MGKPKTITYKTERGTVLPLVEVFIDTYAEQFADPGDILKTVLPLVYGDTYLFEDMPYKQQAEHAAKLSKFFKDYSNYVGSLPNRFDPNK